MRTWILGIVFLGLFALAGIFLFQRFADAAAPSDGARPEASPVPAAAEPPREAAKSSEPKSSEPKVAASQAPSETRPEAPPAFKADALPADPAKRALALTKHVNAVLAASSADPWPALAEPLKLLRDVNAVLWMDPDGSFRSSRVDPAPLSKVAASLAKQDPPVIVGCGLLTKMNRLKNANTVPGHRKLRVPNDSLSVVVRRQSFSLVAYLGDYALDAFPVGIGKVSTPTPSGEFEVREIQHLDKLAKKDTAWIRPEDGVVLYFGDAGFPFGHRFLRFAAPFEHYGIHGTDTDTAIGRAMSHGCVRMKNGDVDTLAELLDPSGPCRVRVRIE
jgi:hypothetical protein